MGGITSFTPTSNRKPLHGTSTTCLVVARLIPKEAREVASSRKSRFEDTVARPRNRVFEERRPLVWKFMFRGLSCLSRKSLFEDRSNVRHNNRRKTKGWVLGATFDHTFCEGFSLGKSRFRPTKKDALLCLYRGLKTFGFLGAQHFSLKDTGCALMVKEICNAVVIEVPDEGIEDEEDPSRACAWNARLHSCVSAKRIPLPILLIRMIPRCRCGRRGGRGGRLSFE